MPFSLEDVKKALEAIDKGSELYEVVTQTLASKEKALEVEKKRGIEEVNKRNREAEGLRKFKKGMESLGFNPEEAELDDFVGGISGNMTKLTEILDDPDRKKRSDKDFKINEDPQFKELSGSFKTLSKKFDEQADLLKTQREKADQLQVRNQNNQIRNVLMKTLGDKVYGPDILVENLITNGKVKLNEDGEKVSFVEGDESVEYDDGIKKLLEARKDIVKSDQAGGGGSGGSGGSGGGEDDKSKEAKKNWVKEYEERR